MAQKSGKGNGNKGFGSMDEARQREISSQGGKASAQSNTSNRGFASMDKSKQREISSLGGKASQSAGRNQRGSTGRNEQPPSKDNDRNYQNKVTSGADMDQRELSSLDEEDEAVRSLRQASYSETDEDEDEGVGDGNIGRSKKSIGSDEEG
jgi:general stress protein YciG